MVRVSLTSSRVSFTEVSAASQNPCSPCGPLSPALRESPLSLLETRCNASISIAGQPDPWNNSCARPQGLETHSPRRLLLAEPIGRDRCVEHLPRGPRNGTLPGRWRCTWSWRGQVIYSMKLLSSKPSNLVLLRQTGSVMKLASGLMLLLLCVYCYY